MLWGLSSRLTYWTTSNSPVRRGIVQDNDVSYDSVRVSYIAFKQLTEPFRI
jgi:hypothetical protein